MRQQSRPQTEDRLPSNGLRENAHTLIRIILDQTVRRNRLRKPRRAARHLADLLKQGLAAPPAGITCRGKSDGAGAQIHAKLSTICFCRTFEIPYIHSALQVAQHVSSESELLAWEHFFNLSHFSGSRLDNADCFVPVGSFLTNVALWRKANFISVTHMHGFADRFPQIYCGLLDELCSASRLGPKPATSQLEIAVHVRRGDVSQSQNQDRFTPTRFIVNALQNVLEGCQAKGGTPRIVIYSQGQAADFDNIATAISCEMSLNGNALDTITALANADVLILSKSSFSYLAGLLCQGIVVYEPFWHSPLPDWIRLALDGCILGTEQRRFINALSQRMRHETS